MGSSQASRSKPFFGGRRRICGPVLGDEQVLDLVLRVACGDPLRDECLYLAGSRRARLIERRVADRAHDLAFEVGERRARLGLGRKCREPPAVTIDDLLLDLALRLPGRDQALEVADDLAARARVRLVERRLAVLAPELRLDLGRGRMRLVGERRRGGREGQDCESCDEQNPHAASASSIALSSSSARASPKM